MRTTRTHLQGVKIRCKTLANGCSRPDNKGATAIAHNMKGYDGHFILDYMNNDQGLCPNVVMNGSKLMSIELKDKSRNKKKERRRHFASHRLVQFHSSPTVILSQDVRLDRDEKRLLPVPFQHSSQRKLRRSVAVD